MTRRYIYLYCAGLLVAFICGLAAAVSRMAGLEAPAFLYNLVGSALGAFCVTRLMRAIVERRSRGDAPPPSTPNESS